MRLPFAVLALAAPLTACATYIDDRRASDQPGAACPESQEWQAWINAMPGPDARPTLIVTGKAHVPPGMEMVLEPGPLDRMMPPTQRFALSMQEGSGPSGWQGVRTEVRPAMPEYRAVIISCEEEEIARIDDVQKVY